MTLSGDTSARSLSAATEEQWRQLALATFGGNEIRAAAAARAAVAAQASGAPADDAFAAASKAYSAAPAEDPQQAATGGTTPASDRVIIRPRGGGALAATLAGAIISGAIIYVIRFHSSFLFLCLLVGCIAAYVLWFGASLRESVIVRGQSVTVRGLVRTKSFHRADVDRIVVLHGTNSWLRRGRSPFHRVVRRVQRHPSGARTRGVDAAGHRIGRDGHRGSRRGREHGLICRLSGRTRTGARSYVGTGLRAAPKPGDIWVSWPAR